MYNIIVVEAEVVASDRGKVVWLGGMGMRVVLGQGDALAFKVGEMRVSNYFGVVLQRRSTIRAIFICIPQQHQVGGRNTLGSRAIS